MYRTSLSVALLALVGGCAEWDRWNDCEQCNRPHVAPALATAAADKKATIVPSKGSQAPNRLPDLGVSKAQGQQSTTAANDGLNLPPTPTLVTPAATPAVTTSVTPAVTPALTPVAPAAASPAPAKPLGDPLLPPAAAAKPARDMVPAVMTTAKPLATPDASNRPADNLARLPELDDPAPRKTPAETTEAHSSDAKEPAVKLINGKRLRLGYQVKDTDVGPTPVELWYTRDGKTWHRDEGPPQVRSPYVVELPEQGVYGLTLVPCKSGARSSQSPQAGEAPQFWVAVDWTRPAVSLLSTSVDAVKQTVSVHWSAKDDHLTGRPITLSWAEQPAGPWMPLAANLPNTGNYTATLPARMPTRFHLRIEAADQAGNVGEAHTTMPVVLELPPTPKVEILAVEVVEE
jgi:hypothetical protein